MLQKFKYLSVLFLIMLIPSVIYYRSNVVHTQIVPVADSYNVSLQTLRFRFFHAVPCNKESNLCWTFEPLAKFHAFHNYETAFLSWKHTESQLKKSNFSKHLSFDAIRHSVTPGKPFHECTMRTFVLKVFFNMPYS